MHPHLATLLFQVANFLVLAGVLRYWLYRPVRAMIDRRQREIEAPLAAASTDRAKAAELLADVERQHLAAAGERNQLLLEAGRDAETRRDQVLADARRAGADLLRSERDAVARERAAAESSLRVHATQLAIGIAARLLATAGTRDATDHLLEEAIRTVESMAGPEPGRALHSTNGHVPVRLVTALPLEPARRDTVTERLHRTLGDRVDVTFTEDAALIAGAEIHLPTAVVRQTWRQQLLLAEQEVTAS
jgi:F-type H+-transporting ATPase subunit b